MVFLLSMITQKKNVDGVTGIIQSDGIKYNSQNLGDLIDSCILVLSRKFEQIKGPWKTKSQQEPDMIMSMLSIP